jgi:putative salt-induced outer membrane protein
MKAAAMAAVTPLLALFAGMAAADWSGTGKLGGVVTRGNTETKTVSAIVDVGNTLDQWAYKFGGTILRTMTDDVTSADRWELRAETNYSFTPRAFTFGTLRYEQDSFTDYAYQATGAGGVGYRFVMTDATKLEATLGVGGRRAEIRVTDVVEESAILRGAMNFEHLLSPTTRIYDRFLVESGRDNTFLQNQAGIEIKINSHFALGLDYTVRRNTVVLPGTRNSDQVYTTNLVYGF